MTNDEIPRRPASLVRPGKSPAPEEPIAFTLTEELAEGQTASAYLRPWNPETAGYDDPAEEDRVSIAVKDYRGRGLAAPEETEGMALRRFSYAGVIYEIVELFWKAWHIDFTLTAELLDSEPSVSAIVEIYYGGGVDPDPEAAGITVWNKSKSPGTSTDYMFEGDSGDKGSAVYDEHDDKYRIRQMECP